MSTFVPTPRDSEAKLQHILLHSAAIFARQGFAGTSIRDISRATGVSLSGLYYYFESKQKLLYLIQNTSFTFIVERLQKRLDRVYEPEMRLRTLVQNHIEYFLSHPNEMKVLSHEEEALESPYREEVAAIKRRYYALARTIFDGLKSEGLASSLNARVAVLSLFGMMNWVYKWHKPKMDPNAEELTNAIVGIFLYGVRRAGAEENALSAITPATTG
ncbi:MAG TPA: TetR/AcrR family transcriptional regulator [Candidatus Sulfotelmatobacter sp.]|nr:TetR/AcrR family transcriptional regulator [Candidatus Sulfotelmatobacter sp.]